MRYALILLALTACGGAKDQTADTVKIPDSVVIDSGPGRDTLIADTLFVKHPDKKPKKEKK